jgi:transposase
MNVLHERCGGLDVHKETLVACRRVMGGAQVVREVRSFPTTTRGLLALADWLRAAGCTHVAMEATGVYWKPVWHVLEGGGRHMTHRVSQSERRCSPLGSARCP